MATALLLRRQLSSTSSLRALSALSSSSLFTSSRTADFLGSSDKQSSSSSTSRSLFQSCSGFEGGVRSLHSGSARLDFRASFASQAAGFAVADYSDDDKTRGGGGVGGGEAGLEISKLDIHPDIVSCLTKRGITKLFPIQKAVLEPAMRGQDMIGRARTGTGKTLAFGIPIMDKITRHNEKNGAGRDPLALVLAPTRELARQVDKEFYESSKLDTLCVYGGSPIARQMQALSSGVDVVCGTPGRVIDLIKRGALDLSHVQFVVLDEADQMLNVGFQEAVEVILEKLPKNRHTMMFSATMPNWIMNLTKRYLKNPVMIDLVGDSDQKLADGISLYSVVTDHRTKAGVIGPLVTEHANGGKCIVFTQTKRDADSLANALGKKNYKCEPLHGDIAQGQRERTLKRFRDADINILVATDVAARGLDIPNVDLIIHYELPSSSEIFVHRSGRTGRAGKKGAAIVIYTMAETRSIKIIERDVGCRFKELPPVATDGTEMDMNMGGGSRFGSGDRYGGFGFGRSGGYGNSNSGGYGNSNSGRSGGYGGSRESGSGRFGSYGGSSRSGGSYEGAGFGRSSGSGFGDRSSGFGNFGSGHQSGGSDSRSKQNSGGFGGGFGNANSSRFGSFGDGF